MADYGARPGHSAQPKPRYGGQHGTGKRGKEGSIEHAKKRTRNIQRLMQRTSDLPANVRSEMERELASHRQTINDKTFQRKRSAMISKYHMVRFFERKKASRLVKQLKRKVEQAEDDTDRQALQKQLHIAEVDEAYTIYHPHAETYISLYGSAKEEKNDDDDEEKTPAAKAALDSERPPMWTVVEQRLKDGENALKRLQERRSPDDDGSAPNRPHPSRAAMISNERRSEPPARPKPVKNGQNQQESGGLNRRERRKLMRESMAAESVKEQDNDDGEGFFEM